MSYWFIIGTAPPVCVFMCIHVNTRVLPVFMNFERVWHESYWVRTGTFSLVRVITWKIRDFTVNTCQHAKFVHRIQWIHVRKHVNWASWTREFTYRTWNHGLLFAVYTSKFSLVRNRFRYRWTSTLQNINRINELNGIKVIHLLAGVLNQFTFELIKFFSVDAKGINAKLP